MKNGLRRTGAWDFRGVKTSTYTHGLHPYPARMVPSIAGELIGRYSAPGDLIYDPFCGSGTTLVEGTLRRRRVLGVDLNPFAVLLSKVKTTPINPELLSREWLTVKRSLLRSSAESRGKGLNGITGRFLDLKFWYKPYVLRDLGFIHARIDDFFSDPDDSVGRFIRVAFARTARDVSNQRPKEFKRWRRPTRELSDYRPKPIQKFVANVERGFPGMTSYHQATRGRVDCRVFLKDARKYTVPSRVSLAVTSPPYGDGGTTVAYGQFSSFALEWLQLSDTRPRHLDQQPLGPSSRSETCLNLSGKLLRTYRRVTKRDEYRAQYMLQFFEGMAEALGNVKASLKPGGVCCIVVGNRRVRGIDVPTDSILVELAKHAGFELEEVFARTVRNKVMPYATKPWNAHGVESLQPTFRTESILVFQAG
jgi:DNA modification methylase